MSSTDVGFRLCASDSQLKCSKMVGHNSRHKVSTNQSLTRVITWIEGSTRARNWLRTMGLHLKMTNGPKEQRIRTNWGRLATGLGRPTTMVGRLPSGPHLLKFPHVASPLIVDVSLRRLQLIHTAEFRWLPPIYMRGGVKKWNTHLGVTLQLGAYEHPS